MARFIRGAETTVEVHGLGELKKAFEKFPENIQRKHLRAAVNEGAKVILYTAINNVQDNTSGSEYSTGKLASSLGIATSSRRKRGFKGSRATARVGVRQGIATRPGKNGPYEYWKPIEFGYWTSRQRWPGESFLVKAFDEKGRQAIKFIVRRLEKAVNIEAKKLDKK